MFLVNISFLKKNPDSNISSSQMWAGSGKGHTALQLLSLGYWSWVHSESTGHNIMCHVNYLHLKQNNKCDRLYLVVLLSLIIKVIFLFKNTLTYISMHFKYTKYNFSKYLIQIPSDYFLSSKISKYSKVIMYLNTLIDCPSLRYSMALDCSLLLWNKT